MKAPWRTALAALAALTAMAALTPQAASAHDRPSAQRVILDTDLGRYWDDVAALSTLNAAQSQGRAKLLGVMVDIPDPYAAPAADAIDTYYRHGDIPIGVPATKGPWPSSYSELLAKRYPHSGGTTDAVTLYRRLLRNQPDHSVVIVAVGGMTNLAGLLRTDPALVERKVRRMDVMGGFYPTSQGRWPEYNFAIDPPATRSVVGGWPTSQVYDGFEVGEQVSTGSTLCATTPGRSPVRGAYDKLFGCGNPPDDGSFDPTAAYYALYGPGDVFAYGPHGTNQVAADGNNTWRNGPGHRQRYLVLKRPAALGHAIDRLLEYVPR